MDKAPSTAPDHLNIEAGPAAGDGDLGVASVGNIVLYEGGGTGTGKSGEKAWLAT